MIHSVREHNNANILSLGGRFISVDEAQLVIKKFIETPFSSDERHVRRLSQF
jgi:ribose 5-phosphate isomerase B